MKRETAIKAIEYEIQQAVAYYIKARAVYEGLREDLEKLKARVDSFIFESQSPLEIMHKVEYIKISLYEIEEMEKQLQEMEKDIEIFKEKIKLLNATKKALKKFLDKKSKIEEKKEVLRELEIAEEIYRNKLITDK